jgi:hypothetical protein
LHCGFDDLILLHDILSCVNDARCTPPLEREQVFKIVCSVTELHLKKRL